MKKKSALERVLLRYDALERDLEDAKMFAEAMQTESDEKDMQEILSDAEQKVEQLEEELLFSGPYDESDAIVTIQSGAGGVDAQDWAEMLLRMYVRWCERKGYRATILDETRGSEAGIKSATIRIAGERIYGKLASEHGTHRLVRLSPFNADSLRQTSFARVEVMPIVPEEEEEDIVEQDMRIDVYRSGGAGGQHVNTTDSAVRITHIPTGIVTSCQNERSQLQNKLSAMAVLRAKLAKRRIEERETEQRKLKGETSSGEWGSQIRSYVVHPYKLVKDHRTKYETAQTDAVLDGDIDGFVDAYLRRTVK